MLGGPYLSQFKNQAKTRRNEGRQPFGESLHDLKDPIHMFQNSGSFWDLNIRIDVLWAKIIFFEEILRVAIRIFRDNILGII